MDKYKINKGDSVLVVGGSGFIGRYLVGRLIAIGAEVTVIGKTLRLNSDQLPYKFIQADIAHKNQLKNLKYIRFDYAFNLGGYIDHRKYMNGGHAVIDSHYVGLLNLLDAINYESLKGFVQVGSSDEYPDSLFARAETLREAPISPYSCSKVAATHLIQMLAKTESFPGVVLRPFLVYGPGQSQNRFIPQIIMGCLQDMCFPASDGQQLRDFCYISDVVEAMILSAGMTEGFGEVINIGSGNPIKIYDLIMLIKDMVGAGTPLFGKVPYRKAESMTLFSCTEKAKAILNWSPEVSMADGLKLTIRYYAANLSKESGIKI